MNVTLGVPRIKEIINAARNISTHIMRVELTNPRDAEAAREVKARLEATTLGSVCEYIKTVVTPFDCYIVVKLDTARLARINVALHASQVARAGEGWRGEGVRVGCWEWGGVEVGCGWGGWVRVRVGWSGVLGGKGVDCGMLGVGWGGSGAV